MSDAIPPPPPATHSTPPEGWRRRAMGLDSPLPQDVTTYAPKPKGPRTMFPNYSGWKAIKAALFALVTLNGVFLTTGVFPPSVFHGASIASLFLGAAGVIVTTLSASTVGNAATLAMARRVAAAGAVVFALAVSQAACSASQQSQELTLGVDTTICVLNHDTDPYPTIALECGLSDLTAIANILAAHKAAAIRDRYIVDAGGQ